MSMSSKSSADFLHRGASAAACGLRNRAAFVLISTMLSVAVHAETLSVLVLDQNGKPVPDAVVVAVPNSSVHPQLKPKEEIVDQVDKEFVPYVKAILVGSTVRFPNKDNIRHHVYSFSAAKSFELPLYAGTTAAPVLFDKPGVVVLGCNIHDWMLGYIYVSESPYFAKTGDDGHATQSDLPREEFLVRVWHPDMTSSEESTVRKVDGGQAGNPSLEWRLDLKPVIRVRRTSPMGQIHR